MQIFFIIIIIIWLDFKADEEEKQINGMRESKCKQLGPVNERNFSIFFVFFHPKNKHNNRLQQQQQQRER